jgi:nucleolar protein 4
MEKEKRQRAQSDKKKKLQNPLHFISNTRLSIRNLSKEVGNNELITLCKQATMKGMSPQLDVPASTSADGSVGPLGLEHKLVTVKDLENQLIAAGMTPVERADQLASISPMIKIDYLSTHATKLIKSAKVMYDYDKLRGGQPVSRGFGFVEFSHHCYALACLRELVSHPNLYRSSAVSAKSPLFVEFSIENIRKVKVLEERSLRAQQNQPIDKKESKKRSLEEPSTPEAAVHVDDSMDMDEESMSIVSSVEEEPVDKPKQKMAKIEKPPANVNAKVNPKQNKPKLAFKEKQQLSNQKRKQKEAKRKAKKAAIVAAKVVNPKKPIAQVKKAKK